jgi:putative oxidoreductase
MAHVTGVAEIVLPILLVIGLFTRFAALGLFAMTFVIFLVYPAQWPNEQLPWAAMALSLVAYGAGKVSLDYLFARQMGR